MFENLKNNIDFFIRQKTRFSRKNFEEKCESRLLRNYLENLYVYDVISRHLSNKSRDSASILDIGSKNWFYAKGEYAFFESFCKNFELDGIEVDAYRLYENLYSRYETAKFYMRGLKNINYITGSLLDIQKEYDFILWFLPFVFKEPHIMWGLPMKLFEPEQMLLHAFQLLKTGGEMLIVNQGLDEACEQEKLFGKLKIPYIKLGNVKSEFFKYKNERYGFLVRK